MGQAKWRKINDPYYGNPDARAMYYNFSEGYPEFYPQELIDHLEKDDGETLSESMVDEIYTHLGSLGRFCQHKVWSLDHEFYNIEPMRVAYATIKSCRFGAFSYTSNGSLTQEKFDFIGINLGTPAILLSNFYKILSHSQSFVGYGNYKSEDPEEPYHALSTVAHPDKDFSPPKCLVRKQYAKLLTEIALDFVIMHEAAHLYKGHSDWVKLDHKFRSSVVEGFEESIIPANKLAAQFLEVDADDCALQFVIASILSYGEDYRAKIAKVNKSKRAAYKLAFGSVMHSLKTLLYAVYVLHRGVDFGEWREEINAESHPRGLLRCRYVFNRFLEITMWHGIATGDREEFENFCLDIVLEAERDMARIEERESEEKRFLDVLKSSKASQHIQQINKMQNIIEDVTWQYVRGNLFPSTAKMKKKRESNIAFRGVNPHRNIGRPSSI